MGLPFQYRRIQRQPLDERLPNGMIVDQAVASQSADDGAPADPSTPPVIQPYDDQDPKPVTVPWHGTTVTPPKTVQPPPAVDPQIINDAFQQPDTATPPKPVQKPAQLSQMPPPPEMVKVDKYHRPEEVVMEGDDLARKQELLQRVRAYQPQNAHGWRRYVGPILQGWRLGQAANPRSPWSGLGGAIMGALTGQFKPKWDDERWKAQKEAEVNEGIDSDLAQEKTQAQLADLQQRPIIRDREQTRKETRDDMLRDQQEWQRRFAERKQDSYEDYVNWRKANGDRRADTAEGQIELRREYQQFQQQFQTRQQNDKERHEKVTERQGQQRVDISKMNAGAQGQFKTRLNAARAAVNRFNDLTRRAAQAASWGDAQGASSSKALTEERDKLEQQIRDQYGDLVSEDDKGKPSGLRKMWSVSQFAKTNPKVNVKAAQARAESEGAIIIP